MYCMICTNRFDKCRCTEDALDEAQAEIARLQAEVAAAKTRGFNAGIEEAAHLIECDGDAMKGKADAARLIRALKRPVSEVNP